MSGDDADDDASPSAGSQVVAPGTSVVIKSARPLVTVHENPDTEDIKKAKATTGR